jgi:hypothetical protein
VVALDDGGRGAADEAEDGDQEEAGEGVQLTEEAETKEKFFFNQQIHFVIINIL